ncbi:hypothetical protein [Sphingobacterium multivorum]|uniref:hypothetical protein n=1 Tax=Sphingobacterium multivorum TaxID=28454 RepID=UPI003DA20F96
MEFNYPGYELRFVQKKNIKDGSDHLFSFIYKFRSEANRLNYIVTADYHFHDFFAIKFYPQRLSKLEYKYSKITNSGDVQNILITCLKVLPILLEQYPNASFGFIGARSYDKSRVSGREGRWEPEVKTQRFRLYTYIAKKKIGNVTFQHFQYPEISGYMFVNRNCEDVDVRERELIEMLSNCYEHISNPF